MPKISTSRVSLTPEKTGKLISACQTLLAKESPSIRDVAQTIGLLVASLPGVQYGPIYYPNSEINKIEAPHTYS